MKIFAAFFALTLCGPLAAMFCGKVTIEQSNYSVDVKDPEFGSISTIIFANPSSSVLRGIENGEEYCFVGDYEKTSSGLLFYVREVYFY